MVKKKIINEFEIKKQIAENALIFYNRVIDRVMTKCYQTKISKTILNNIKKQWVDTLERTILSKVKKNKDQFWGQNFEVSFQQIADFFKNDNVNRTTVDNKNDKQNDNSDKNDKNDKQNDKNDNKNDVNDTLNENDDLDEADEILSREESNTNLGLCMYKKIKLSKTKKDTWIFNLINFILISENYPDLITKNIVGEANW